MFNFGERLKEEIDNVKSDIEKVADSLNVAKRMVYEWCANENQPSMQNLIKLANYFNCSIDYLIDLEPKYEDVIFKDCPKFSSQFINILKRCKSTKFAVSKGTKISRSAVYEWVEGKTEPTLDSLIKIAKFLNITIDELVGRQN